MAVALTCRKVRQNNAIAHGLKDGGAIAIIKLQSAIAPPKFHPYLTVGYHVCC